MGVAGAAIQASRQSSLRRISKGSCKVRPNSVNSIAQMVDRSVLR